jgi:hypothetical protein
MHVGPVGRTFARFARTLVKIVRRLSTAVLSLFNFADKATVSSMINKSRKAANKVVKEYLSMDDARDLLGDRFLKNVDSVGQTIVRTNNISRLSKKAKDSIDAYTSTIAELKTMASELKSFLSRAG